MNKTAKDLIYLLSCAVNGITPDTEKVQAIDLESLYILAKAHTLRAAVYIAFRSAGVIDYNFQQAYNKAVRKNVMLDVERTAILAEFEKRGIWYMPLKGSILKELYPENGMREMADNDILYDSTKQSEIKEVMLGMGYSAESVGRSHHDVYMKPPVLNFELHTLLFDTASDFYGYYQDTKRLMIPDESSKYGYHFSDEDFYVYMLAHEYKHYSTGGTGLRSLLDRYVFLQNKGDSLDRAYIREQTEQLGLTDFEREQGELAEKVFSSATFPELTEREQELLDYYLSSNTYGTITRTGENMVRKTYSQTQNRSRIGYICRRIIPDKKHMKAYFLFFYKHKLLLPIGYIWRIIRAPFIRKERIKAEMKALRKYDNKKV